MSGTVDKILTALSARTSQDFFSYSRSLVQRRIDERIALLGYASPEDYANCLEDDPDEAEQLVRMLLIRYSRFFRHPLQFQLLKELLLPPALAETGGIYRVWSAACAAGEEAFSLAIILDEASRAVHATRMVALFATDIAEDALQEGRSAFYLAERLADVSLGRLNTYFNPENGGYRVCDDLRRQVSFSRHNLLDRNSFAPPESVFGGFDLILCRNFLMYLSEEAYVRVFDNLYRALNPGGILMLGRAESVPEAYHDVMVRLYDFGGLYRKTVVR
ncbi:MAG TPA: protein-glutamate O-methyltransferase CheR [Desulfuromonadales bacterium]|nr:protein-glutamate O-methyltransferase CheR [Desulfuromonadales bacterium]